MTTACLAENYFYVSQKDYSLFCQNTTVSAAKELSSSKPNDFRVWNQKTLPFPSKVGSPEPNYGYFPTLSALHSNTKYPSSQPKPCHLFRSSSKFVLCPLLYLLIIPAGCESFSFDEAPIWTAMIVFFTVSLLSEKMSSVRQTCFSLMSVEPWEPFHELSFNHWHQTWKWWAELTPIKQGPSMSVRFSPLRCELEEVSQGTLHS